MNLTGINWIDILLIAVVLLAAWSGWQKGFIVGALELGLMLGSFLTALWSYQYVSNLVIKYIPTVGAWSQPLAFILVLIFVRIILSAIVNSFLRITPYEAHGNVVNRLLGVAPGVLTGLIYATILSALLLATPLFDGLTAKAQNSTIANRLAQPAEWLETKMAPVFDEAVRRSMNRMTVEPNSDETVKLPFTVTNPKVREDLEARMLVLVNKERTKRGLKPLQADPEIQVVARKHSVDMFARGYFSHYTPEGKDPFDRMRADGIKFLAAGENLALAQTLSIAHTGLMNSPGHRANILRPAFGRVGIGVLDGGIHGLMITQNFRN
jgi:uncharacterized protein YkwD